MNRPFLRKLAVKLGYSVHQRSSHVHAVAWDWGPKDAMQGSHFNSEERAWANLEEHMLRECQQAERVVHACQELNRETLEEQG